MISVNLCQMHSTFVDSVVSLDRRLLGGRCAGPNASAPTSSVVLLAALALALLAVVPLNFPELTLGLVGALTYLGLQCVKGRKQKKTKATSSTKVEPSACLPKPQRPAPVRKHEPRPPLLEPPKQDYRQKSAVPVLAPKFKSVGWDAEVSELLDQISPTQEGEEVMCRLIEKTEEVIRTLIPEASVSGFASGNLKRGKAFGVAIPEVNLVVTVALDTLALRLRDRLSKTGRSLSLDSRKLQKSAIRACTDQLVALAGFKFRRSAFRGEEPKVTLLAPGHLAASEEAIPVDFSVNTVSPLRSAALLEECGRLEPRAKDLILLVHRWARDRGISHAVKGHLPPYAWSLLCIYYLQVGSPSEGPLLPPFGALASCADPFTALSCGRSERAAARNSITTTAAALFKGFVRFYREEFHWRREAVSVRLGRRAPPELSLPLHIVLAGGARRTEVAPSLEDPFEPSRNISSTMTSDGIVRFREELQRAHELCSSGASLAALLTPWAPPEYEALKGGKDRAQGRALL